MRVQINADETGPEAPVVQPPQETPKQPDEAPQEIPAWVPAKFVKDGVADYESLAKSYTELEKKNSQPKVEQPKPDEKPGAADVKPDEKPKVDEKAGEQPAQSPIPGVTVEQTQQYTKELQETGKLSDDSYAALAKAGYTRQAVDTYIAGAQRAQAEQSAMQQAQVAEVKGLAGGDQGYKAMSDWMQTNLSAEDLTAYNEAVGSGKLSIVKLAVKDMHARYTEAVGSEPKLLGGSSGGDQPTGGIFRSFAEVTEAMANPKYSQDPAYRKDIEDRLRRSKI